MSNEIEKPLVNRVAKSPIVTINLEDFFPKFEIVDFDIEPFLFRGLILREKDFRLALKEIDWSKYEGKVLCAFCSADAIIPQWAYMLISVHAAPFVKDMILGSSEEYLNHYYREALSKEDLSSYEGKPIVIKGCGSLPVPTGAYVTLSNLLFPIAKSIMYGEPCSMVPVFKRKRK